MVKVNLRPVGDYRGSGSIYRVRSASNPMGYHFVCVIYNLVGTEDKPTDLERVVECSCTGFQVHHNCWHEEKVIEWEEARLTLGDNERRIYIASEDSSSG